MGCTATNPTSSLVGPKRCDSEDGRHTGSDDDVDAANGDPLRAAPHCCRCLKNASARDVTSPQKSGIESVGRLQSTTNTRRHLVHGTQLGSLAGAAGSANSDMCVGTVNVFYEVLVFLVFQIGSAKGKMKSTSRLVQAAISVSSLNTSHIIFGLAAYRIIRRRTEFREYVQAGIWDSAAQRRR